MNETKTPSLQGMTAVEDRVRSTVTWFRNRDNHNAIVFGINDAEYLIGMIDRLRAEVLMLRKERDAALKTIRELEPLLAKAQRVLNEAVDKIESGWSDCDDTEREIEAALDKLKEQRG